MTIPQIVWAISAVLAKELLAKYHWIVLCRGTFMLGAMMVVFQHLGNLAIPFEEREIVN